MDNLSKAMYPGVERPIKILQFGEGNFLRAFVDYMVDVANEKGVFDGNILMVKPIEYGNLDMIKKQDNRYTLSMRGLEDGEAVVRNRVITSVADTLSVYDDYEGYLALAGIDTLRFVVSNTTEAGIVYEDGDLFGDKPPKTFPAKMTRLLFERYKAFGGDPDKGLIMLPVELIDDNGTKLKECVMGYSRLWALEEAFINWMEEACVFCNTLVDRIVTGFPAGEAQQIWGELGYEDQLLVTSETFALWVIESDRDISKEFPLDRAGMPVIFTDNHKPYKQRKVRILNGAHTSFVLASYLKGNDYVLESMKDPAIRHFLEAVVYEEVIPTLTLPVDELKGFAHSVIERFENPFIKHALLAISLNSVSKWRARCLPSFLGYYEKFNTLPKHLNFSMAALMCFYSGEAIEGDSMICRRGDETYKVRDDRNVLEFFKVHSGLDPEVFAKAYLGKVEFHGMDLNTITGLTEAVAGYVENIRSLGMAEAMRLLSQEVS